MKRRTFIKTTLAASLASSATMNAFALAKNNPFRKNIGIQLYTLRNQINKDTIGTIKAVADAGYKQVEPYGFPNADDMIKASKDFGMEVNSSHFAWESVTAPDKKGVVPFDDILQKAQDLGLSHLVIPYLQAHEREGVDGFKKIAEKCNRAAAKAKTAGIQLAYHNHNFEFAPLKNGKTGLEIFAEEFADEMQFEIDVFWVKIAGVDPLKIMKKLKGRISQLHLKDLKSGLDLPLLDTGDVPKDAFKELGNGIIDMEPIIEAAWVAGVDHCHVEQDQSPDPVASIQESMKYLAAL